MLPDRISRLEQILGQAYKANIISADELVAIGKSVTAANAVLKEETETGKVILAQVGTRYAEHIDTLCKWVTP